MKIRQKLILGFVGIASLVGVVGIMCVNTSQKALQKSIGENSVALAVETMDKIDRHIYHTIEEFQTYCCDLILLETVTESNREFQNIENIQEYIDKIDTEWISADKGTAIPLLQELKNNRLSKELREKIGFHEKKYGYKVFGEIFVTNKYGATVALTEKTSDYRQDDEQWWKEAKEEDLCVCDVEYDESSDVHSTTIAIRSNDEEGNFAGVMKIVLSIEETIDIINKTREVTRYKNVQFNLLNENGKSIFDGSRELNFLEDVSDEKFFKEMAGDRGYMLNKPADGQEKKEELLVFARSKGHNDYKGLGWILTIQYQTAELFAPVVKLRNIILSTSLALTILAVIPGLLISNYISKPLSKLEAAMNKIGKGDMGIKVDVKRNDEIGQLAHTFNEMVEHRKQAEEALRISEGKLGAMLHAIADDIALIDRDLNIIWTNDAARKIFGDDIVGRKCYDVYHHRNEPCEPYPCPVLQTFRDGKIHQYETEVTGKNGKSRHIHCVANVALRDEEGKPTGVLEICRDLTERKQTEEALRMSERKYSDLVQQAPDAIISLDKIGNFLSFNPAAERISGFSAHEVLDKHFTRIGILDKKSIPTSLKEFGLILAGVERQPFELIITRKDKSRLFMEANGRLIRQNKREPWIQVTLRDITERKQSEERLEKINKCLLSLGSDFTKNANRITSLLGELLGADCALYNRLDDGLLCSQAMWKTPPDFNPQDKPDGHICYDIIQQGADEVCVVRDLQNSPYAQSDPNVLAYGLKTYVGRAVTCDGRCVGSLCAAFTTDFEPSKDEKKIIGILVSAMRVEEERRRVKEKLRQSQKAAEDALKTGELILETMPVGVIIVGKDKTIRRVNKTALKMMGCSSPEEIIGNICHKKICPADVNKCPVMDLGKSVDNSERVLLNRNGLEVPILKTVLPITLEGEDVLLEAFVDITERRLAEQELEKLNRDLETAVWELRRANKELKEFAYITAHDLKTPLRGIGTLADWISRDYAEKFDEEGKQQVRLLVEKAKQMSALIDDILQYSRLGHDSPNKQQVDLNALVSEVITGINPPENIKITIENGLPALICEKTQIMQVFQNLISNAVKYMDKPEGQIKVGFTEEDGFWKFSVADNGPGINRKYFKKIFKIFQTLSTHNRVDSTGIGLSIVKKVVELNAGAVWVESEPGRGSIFFFTVPKSGIRQQTTAETVSQNE